MPANKAGFPVYTNRVRGAAHMLEKPAADGFYYAYDIGENLAWQIHKSKDAIHWQLLPQKGTPNGTWGKKNF